MSRFLTLLACIDGRIHPLLQKFIYEEYSDYCVDVITAPGIVGKLFSNDQLFGDCIIKACETSISAHKSEGIIVAAHSDCAGNPVPDEVQLNQLFFVAEKLQSRFGLKVVKLFIDTDKAKIKKL